MTDSDAAPDFDGLLNMDGRTVLVTGASGNIGQGIARRLAEAGAGVVAHFRSGRDAAEALVGEIQAAGGRALAVQADLGTADDVDRMFRQMSRDGLAADLVVNNAASQTVAALDDLTPDDWREMMLANLDSAFLVTRLAAMQMCNRGVGGAIVNVASIEGSDPASGHGHYATSKAGLLMLTRACALEYGEHGIRVNAVSPGLIEREGLDTDWPDGVARWQDNAPLVRMGLASDVADAVLFLLSPAARWISGANLVVDGGMSAVSRW